MWRLPVSMVVMSLLTGCGAPIVQDLKSPILLGEISREQLETGSYARWFHPAYDEYQPDSLVVNYLSGELDGVQISVYVGTWCGDTKRQLPRLFNLMDELELSQEDLTMVGLDRDKRDEQGDERVMGVHRTPTVILSRAGRELGRIIETPVETLERDMLRIVTGRPIPLIIVSWSRNRAWDPGKTSVRGYPPKCSSPVFTSSRAVLRAKAFSRKAMSQSGLKVLKKARLSASPTQAVWPVAVLFRDTCSLPKAV